MNNIKLLINKLNLTKENTFETYGSIYKIINKVDGKYYVGSSRDILEFRWPKHKRQLINNNHPNDYLQNSWNKYGSESFKYEIIENCSIDILLQREEYWIQNLNSHKNGNGYNFTKTPRATRLGCKASDVTKKKMSLALGGKNHPNWRRKLSKSHVENIKKATLGIQKPNSGKKKIYSIISPIGDIIEINGLRKFCRNNNLNHSQLWRVVTGKQKEYKGWKSTLNVRNINYKRKVCAICNECKYYFQSMMAATKSDIFDTPIKHQNISICCRYINKSCGKINNKKVYWRFI